ncbi:MAG: SET domain-containing protein-lysine N-methyltransferase [Chlamydiota bacterium]
MDKLFDRKISLSQFLGGLDLPLFSDPYLKVVSTRDKRSLFHYAVLENQLELIKNLKMETSLLSRQDVFGLTPLELAQFLDRKECIRLLCRTLPQNSFCDQPNLSLGQLDSKVFAGLEYLSHPIFESNEGLEAILQRVAKAKLEDKIPAEKIWMGIYFDKEIQRGYHPPISIRYVDAEVGFGVFAELRIPPCGFLGEYTGVVQERKTKDLKDKRYCLRYTAWDVGNKNFVLNAEEKGNFTRLINHSAEPNLGLQSVFWRGLPRMIFVALKEILPDTQLTFDYGNLFWKECHQTPKVL